MRPIMMQSEQQPRRGVLPSQNHPKEMMNQPRCTLTMS
jgi:hypothetical protein